MKRNRTERENQESLDKSIDINKEFLKKCKKDFNANPSNIICRNAVVSIGSMLSSTNSNRLNDIDYVFLNSIKEKDVKATNQGHSGRCWMFAGLNMFRHNVIKGLGLDNFEFSETYLFFWDKLERANTYLRWFIDNPEVDYNDLCFRYVVGDFMSDGGWWHVFANLVEKYGLIPKNAMKETWQSADSEDMNKILEEHLHACANYIRKNNKKSEKELVAIKDKTMTQVYNILVKFLGEPPEKFRWGYNNSEYEPKVIDGLTPIEFKNMLLSGVSMDDFVVLSSIPFGLEMNKKYTVKHTKNIYEGRNFETINVPIQELTKYATKSVVSGMPVWFAADVCQDFNMYHSALDDALNDETRLFGEPIPFNKKDRIMFRHLQANHAMCFIGVNLDHKKKTESWQVENSWGFWDKETPGEDGFLYMSQSWFEKNVMEVVIHKNYLSRSITKLLSTKAIELEPWDFISPALRVKPRSVPKNYINMIRKNRFHD